MSTEMNARYLVETNKIKSRVTENGARLVVVSAPPGSGKTEVLVDATNIGIQHDMRIAIATQTNSQAREVCERFARKYPKTSVSFYGKSGSSPTPNWPSTVRWVTSSNDLPWGGRQVVVATAAKWGLASINAPFDLLFVEEAWQLTWADFYLLGKLAPRFFLIGDPGQIAPVVTVPTQRWETMDRPPHIAAPEVALCHEASQWFRIPATRRLPFDSAEAVRGFYDFDFGATSAPDARRIKPQRRVTGFLSKVFEAFDGGSITGLTIATPREGPPVGCDLQLVATAVDVVRGLLDAGTIAKIDDSMELLQPSDIGIVSTHRRMVTSIEEALSAAGLPIVVDTTERWQGLERKVMIAVHPLSSVISPSGFDLETGRLCVMASRHKAALFILSRDHLTNTLEEHFPLAEQAPGRPDGVGRGAQSHRAFWTKLTQSNRVFKKVA